MNTGPAPRAEQFSTAVRGTIFGKRSEIARRLRPGDALLLIPDPPGVDEPSVWVHARGGDVLGHLAPDVNLWLVPWLLAGGRCQATVAKINSEDTESWRRIIIDVRLLSSPHELQHGEER
ncbi:MAG: hypothetical protein ACJ79K_09400 [Gemmatimonadaceae bacterium]